MQTGESQEEMKLALPKVVSTSDALSLSLCPMALFRVFPLPIKWLNIPTHESVSSVDYFLQSLLLIIAEDLKTNFF